MQISSGDLIDVTNEVALSGKFLQLARNGQLVAVSEKIQDRVKIAKELAEVEGRLKAFDDPASLSEFEKRYRKSKRRFEARLPELAASLEVRKRQLQTELQQIDDCLQKEQLDFEWEVDPTALMTSLVPKLVKKINPSVEDRNQVIDRSLGLTDLEICRLLDQNFVRDGEVSDSFPERWERDFSVKTFVTAYYHPQCRNRVHTLISKRRHLSSYLNT